MVPVSFPSPLARYRWAVAARSVLGAGGGYALAAAWSSCMSLLFLRLGMTRMDAVTGATMLSFIVYACAASWVFATASLRRACIGIVVPAALLGLGAWRLGAAAGGAA